MGDFWLWGSPETGANTFPDRCGVASTDRYTHFRGIEAHSLPILLLRPMAGRSKRLSIPVLETKDTIGLGYCMPAFDICYSGAIVLTNFHVPSLEFRCQRPDL
jgi:hypothetical protein